MRKKSESNNFKSFFKQLHMGSQKLGGDPDPTDMCGENIQNKDVFLLLSSCNTYELNWTHTWNTLCLRVLSNFSKIK